MSNRKPPNCMDSQTSFSSITTFIILFASNSLHLSTSSNPIQASSAPQKHYTNPQISFHSKHRQISNTAMPISSVSADPLFSSIITIYILILLYFPSACIGIVLSPVLISTSVILLSLLRLGAIQKKKKKHQPSDPDPVFTGDGDQFGMMGSWEDRDPGVGAPLEVIHEGPENDDVLDGKKCGGFMSLSEIYPETDSDSDISSEDFPAAGNVDDEDRDGMIEIELSNDIEEEEEDNLIEIDLHLSVAR